MSRLPTPGLAPHPPGMPPDGARACSLDALRGARRPPPHARFRLVAVAEPGLPSDARRLALLGLRPGAELTVLHPPGPRGAVLGVGTARIALGRELVRQLQVVQA